MTVSRAQPGSTSAFIDWVQERKEESQAIGDVGRIQWRAAVKAKSRREIED
jgi:hypothetical protein